MYKKIFFCFTNKIILLKTQAFGHVGPKCPTYPSCHKKSCIFCYNFFYSKTWNGPKNCNCIFQYLKGKMKANFIHFCFVSFFLPACVMLMYQCILLCLWSSKSLSVNTWKLINSIYVMNRPDIFCAYWYRYLTQKVCSIYHQCWTSLPFRTRPCLKQNRFPF